MINFIQLTVIATLICYAIIVKPMNAKVSVHNTRSKLNSAVATWATDNDDNVMISHRTKSPSKRLIQKNVAAKQVTKRIYIPVAIKHVKLKQLDSVALHGEHWRELDFCSTASKCGDMANILHWPLTRADVQTHQVIIRNEQTFKGYYATLLGQPDYYLHGTTDTARIEGIGKGCLGWHSQGEAIDHLLLYIILLSESGHDWQSRWAQCIFPWSTHSEG